MKKLIFNLFFINQQVNIFANYISYLYSNKYLYIMALKITY
jgi:hypothetical protein